MRQARCDSQADSLRQDVLAVAQGRDTRALERLFDHYAPKIRAFCLASQPGANLMADDIAQEVMIRIWNKAQLYKSEAASLDTWVFTLARNARIDYLRKNSRHLSDIDPEYLWRDIVDDSLDPFRDVQQKRNQQAIHSGLKQLPSDQRQVLSKVYLEGKTHKEAADELALPLGTIKSRVRLALQKLTIYIKR
ncbi:sigma-70 family RNA polymerase sigma factor [Marinomonas epiphytica]